MNWKTLKQRTSLNLISSIILVAGLGSAAFIYQRAGNDPYGKVTDGSIYLFRPEKFKMYRHNLEVYGGKFSVIMDDFWRWFASLWYGKSLAFIIACISIIIASALFYAANYLPPPSKPEVHNGNDPDGSG